MNPIRIAELAHGIILVRYLTQSWTKLGPGHTTQSGTTARSRVFYSNLAILTRLLEDVVAFIYYFSFLELQAECLSHLKSLFSSVLVLEPYFGILLGKNNLPFLVCV